MAKTTTVYSFGAVAKCVAKSWELALYVLLHVYDATGTSIAGSKRSRAPQAGIDLPKDLREKVWRASVDAQGQLWFRYLLEIGVQTFGSNSFGLWSGSSCWVSFPFVDLCVWLACRMRCACGAGHVRSVGWWVAKAGWGVGVGVGMGMQVGVAALTSRGCHRPVGRSWV